MTLLDVVVVVGGAFGPLYELCVSVRSPIETLPENVGGSTQQCFHVFSEVPTMHLFLCIAFGVSKHSRQFHVFVEF